MAESKEEGREEYPNLSIPINERTKYLVDFADEFATELGGISRAKAARIIMIYGKRAIDAQKKEGTFVLIPEAVI